MAAAAVEGLEVHQLDIKTAFVNGVQQEEVYVEQSAGYQELEGGPRHTYRMSLTQSTVRTAPSATSMAHHAHDGAPRSW